MLPFVPGQELVNYHFLIDLYEFYLALANSKTASMCEDPLFSPRFLYMDLYFAAKDVQITKKRFGAKCGKPSSYQHRDLWLGDPELFGDFLLRRSTVFYEITDFVQKFCFC